MRSFVDKSLFAPALSGFRDPEATGRSRRRALIRAEGGAQKSKGFKAEMPGFWALPFSGGHLRFRREFGRFGGRIGDP